MGESSVTNIGGMNLPGALLLTLGGGRWKPPEDVEVITKVFGDEPDWPQFYDLATMVRQNQFFQGKSAAELEEDTVGSRRGLDIDPALAVLIASLGADMPVALDYRLSRDDPRVIYLGSDGWREVAPNIETLCRRLGL